MSPGQRSEFSEGFKEILESLHGNLSVSQRAAWHTYVQDIRPRMSVESTHTSLLLNFINCKTSYTYEYSTFILLL